MDKTLTHAIANWQELTPLLTQPESEAEYTQRISYLDELLDIVGENEEHELIPLIDLLSDAISQYEAVYQPQFVMGSGVDALKYLIGAHQLKQKDLHFLGSQGVVSEILNGKRKLNMRHIKALAKYFKLNPATFID